jgi:hypothetical protein
MYKARIQNVKSAGNTFASSVSSDGSTAGGTESGKHYVMLRGLSTKDRRAAVSRRRLLRQRCCRSRVHMSASQWMANQPRTQNVYLTSEGSAPSRM